MYRSLLVALAWLPAFAADPDFTGTWRLNESRSEMQRGFRNAPRVLKLEHAGTAVACDDGTSKFTFTVDRKESRHDSVEGTRSSVAKWEGSTILVNTIVMKKAGGQHTEMDRWNLSADGNTLRIRRQVVSLSDQSEAVLVYEREGAAPPAVLAKRAVQQVSAAAAAAEAYKVQSGTRIPLALINSVNTKNSVAGDRIYLQTVFPVLVDGRVVVPPGSFVNGTVTQVKRPGRVKGRGELYVRFDSLILPNGTAREFRARIGAGDARAGESVDREEGRISGGGNKGGDAGTVADSTIYGGTGGVMGGAAAGNVARGAQIGLAAGAAAGLATVLLTRGPEAQLTAGSVVEMVLDRELEFTAAELDRPAVANTPLMVPATGPQQQQPSGSTLPRRRLPF